MYRDKVVELSKQSSSENKQHRLLFDKEIENNIETLKNKLKNEKSIISFKFKLLDIAWNILKKEYILI